MKIAHISDLHFTEKDFEGQLAQFSNILLPQIQTHNPDHYVITGDIVDSANKIILSKFVDILKEKNIFHAKTLTVVQGNHDIFTKNTQNNGEENLEFFSSLFQPLLNSQKDRWQTQHILTPFIKNSINGITFLGIDTTPRCKLGLGSGLFQAEEIEWLVDEIKEDIQYYEKRKIILLMHHNPINSKEKQLGFVSLNIKNQEVLESLLNLITPIALMCGHHHMNSDIYLIEKSKGKYTFYTEASSYRNTKVYCMGLSGGRDQEELTKETGQIILGYNLFTITNTSFTHETIGVRTHKLK